MIALPGVPELRVAAGELTELVVSVVERPVTRQLQVEVRLHRRANPTGPSEPTAAAVRCPLRQIRRLIEALELVASRAAQHEAMRPH